MLFQITIFFFFSKSWTRRPLDRNLGLKPWKSGVDMSMAQHVSDPQNSLGLKMWITAQSSCETAWLKAAQS